MSQAPIRISRSLHNSLIKAADIAKARESATIDYCDVAAALSRRLRRFGGDFADVLALDCVEAGDVRQDVAVTADFVADAAEALRQVHWQVFTRFPSARSPPPEWSADVEHGLALSLNLADRSERRWLQAVDMFDEAIAVPGTHLAQTCRRIGAVRTEVQNLVSRFEDDQVRCPPFLGDNPYILGLTGDFSSIHRQLFKALVRRRFRRKTGSSVVLYFVELGAALQAVRLGHPLVHPVHVLLSVRSLHDHMACVDAAFGDDVADANTPILERHDVSYVATLKAVRRVTPVGVAAPEDPRRVWRTAAGFPRWSVSAVEVVERARRAAEGQRVDAGTLHVLAALLDANGETEALLAHVGVDAAGLRQEIETAVAAMRTRRPRSQAAKGRRHRRGKGMPFLR